MMMMMMMMTEERGLKQEVTYFSKELFKWNHVNHVRFNPFPYKMLSGLAIRPQK